MTIQPQSWYQAKQADAVPLKTLLRALFSFIVLLVEQREPVINGVLSSQRDWSRPKPQIVETYSPPQASKSYVPDSKSSTHQIMSVKTSSHEIFLSPASFVLKLLPIQ